MTECMGGEWMKKRRIFIAIVHMSSTFCMIIFSLLLTVNATDTSNITVKNVPESLDASIIFLEETKSLIKCFDVNEDGWFALGFNNNTIQIYDANGTFQYGYSFHTDGTYGLELQESSVVIYLARSNVAVELEKTGNSVRAESVPFSKTFAGSVMDRTSKKVRNVQYLLERDIGIFDGYYSRFVSIGEGGTRVILYDTTVRGYFSGIFQYILLSIFPIGFVSIIVRKIKEEDKQV